MLSKTSALLSPRSTALDPKDVNTFLRLVAEGEQDQAEAMLQKNRDLVLVPGNVTDLSERTFNGITAFQYAVWALDWHMWTMIKQYMPGEEVSKQVQGLETGAWVKQHGKSVSWQNLLNALNQFIVLMVSGRNDEAHVQGKQIGNAQRLLPTHVINEYCHPNRPFNPCPNFSAGLLPRTRQIAYRSEWFINLTNSEWNRIFRGAKAKATSWGGVEDDLRELAAQDQWNGPAPF